MHRNQEAETCHIAIGCHVPDAEEEGVWLGSFGSFGIILYGFLCGIYQAILIMHWVVYLFINFLIFQFNFSSLKLIGFRFLFNLHLSDLFTETEQEEG